MPTEAPPGTVENPIEQSCRYLAIHEGHTYTRMTVLFRCAGVPHDHAVVCCREHGTHAMPHNGCILR